MVTFEIHASTHPAYNSFTLFTDGSKGIGVIQQRYDPRFKCTWWGPIDKDHAFYILHSPYFDEWWEDSARVASNGLYHVMEIRKVMWALHMKPLPKEPWETKFY